MMKAGNKKFRLKDDSVLAINQISVNKEIQERLIKCWLIQSAFSRNCAKEEEDSHQNF